MIEDRQENTKVFLIKLAILALITRFSIAAAYYNIFISALQKPFYAFDGEAYSIMGWYIALVLKGVSLFPLPQHFIPNDYSVIGGLYGTIAQFGGGLPALNWPGVGPYSYLVGGFYYVFGYAPVLLRFFNSILSVASAFIVYLIARKNFNENTARIALVLSLFLPSFVLYSASLQRDTMVNFLILLILYQIFAVRQPLARAVNIMRFAWLSLGLVLLYFLRVNAALVVLVFIFLYLYLNFIRAFRYIGTIFTVSLFAIPPIREAIFGFIKSKATVMLNYHLYLSYLGGYTFKLLPESYYRPEPILAGQKLSYIPLGDCVTGYFNGITAFLFQPFPLNFYKAYHLLALPYVLLWYFILLFAVVGICSAMKNITVERAGLGILLLLFTSSIAMSEANVETLIRHRDMIMPAYIIFASYGMEYIRTLRKGST